MADKETILEEASVKLFDNKLTGKADVVHSHKGADIGVTQELLEDTDLNDITTQGIYTCTSGNSATLKNKPFIGSSTCIIENKNFSDANSTLIQTVYNLESYTTMVYVRSYKNSTWGSWRYLGGTGNNPIPATITVDGETVNNDLNNYKQEGLFTCSKNSVPTINNMPFTDKRAFYLRVIDYRMANYLIQILFPITDDNVKNKVYYRVMFGKDNNGDDIWLEWKTFPTTDEIPNVENSLYSDSTTDALSAAQGKALNTALNGKTVTLTKLSTATTGYIATYEIKQGDSSIGVIDIPKDYLVKSASVGTCTKANQPVSGYKVGDKYLDFIINTKDSSATDEHLYINVTDLVDVYTADNSTLELNNGQFKIKDTGVTLSKLNSDVYDTTSGGTEDSSKLITSGAVYSGLSGKISKTSGNTNLLLANGSNIAQSTFNKVNVVDSLSSDSSSDALSAKQGKALNTALSGKSDTGHTHPWSDLNITTIGETAHSHNIDALYLNEHNGKYVCGYGKMSNLDGDLPWTGNPSMHLLVISSGIGGKVAQIAFQNNNAHKIFFRTAGSLDSTTNLPSWSEWYQIASTSDIPTKLSELTNDLSKTIINSNIADNTIELDKLNTSSIIDSSSGGTSGSDKLITSGAVYSGLNAMSSVKVFKAHITHTGKDWRSSPENLSNISISAGAKLYLGCSDQNNNYLNGYVYIDWNNGASFTRYPLSYGWYEYTINNAGVYHIRVYFANSTNKIVAAGMCHVNVS